jgi:hypothetical protein
MPETKDAAAQLAALRAENDRLRQQLATATARQANVPAAKPYLTEGERQDLITFGVTNDVHTGRRLNLNQARELYPDADLVDATDAAVSASERDHTEAVERSSVRGVDYVWPSVAPGQIDPAVAGLPGINGPAAK